MNDTSGHDHSSHGHQHGMPDTVKDPVCGMLVAPAKTAHQAEHDDQSFFFCSSGCKSKFIADPVRYTTAQAKPATSPAAAGTIYTCPMHPQIRQSGPGSCPICGMALEPEMVTADSGPNPELIDMTRRFWVGLGLT
uniref:heavy metal-binding domain-containing protein n=1 Tax=Ferrovibrio sp. TaxID=1917215 RepID=UPI001B67D15C